MLSNVRAQAVPRAQLPVWTANEPASSPSRRRKSILNPKKKMRLRNPQQHLSGRLQRHRCNRTRGPARTLPAKVLRPRSRSRRARRKRNRRSGRSGFVGSSRRSGGGGGGGSRGDEVGQCDVGEGLFVVVLGGESFYYALVATKRRLFPVYLGPNLGCVQRDRVYL